jgi:predicted RNA methylase
MNVQLFFPDFDTPYEFDSIQDIVDKLNYSIGNPGWTSARAAHDMMLVDTLIDLGVDVSEIKKGNTVSFLHKVAYDKEHNKLVIADGK